MYYFASDIHLGAGAGSGCAADEAAARTVERRFLAWLDEVSRDAEAIFLLGDLFDFWFEWRRAIPKTFVRVLGKLAELTDRGIRVVWLTGNHDQWVGDFFAKECGMEVYTSPQIRTLAGKRVFLAHGDSLIFENRLIQLRNKLFHSSTMRNLFARLVHPDAALRFGQAWSRSSRKKHEGREDHLSEPLIEYARKQDNIDLAVFGHTHHARDYAQEGLRVLFLGEWEHNPVYATLDAQGNAALKRFER